VLLSSQFLEQNGTRCYCERCCAKFLIKKIGHFIEIESTEVEIIPMSNHELTFEKARKWYFLGTDAYNVIFTMTGRELKHLYDSKLVVVFIDCYDLISFLFPKDMLIHDDHYEWNRTLWSNVFDTLHGNDNLKICVSPPTCLELFHFLERKAYYVYKGTPTITNEDQRNWQVFLKKLTLNQYALSLTESLINQASKTVSDLLKLKELIIQRKVINASEVFDYSKPDWKAFVSIVSPKFDSQKAAEFLKQQRQGYLSRKKNGPPLDLYNLGLDSFSVNIDISNITQTIYIDSVCEDTKFTFTSHGIYLILCCHKERGFWKKDKEAPPVMNSLLPLFLSKALRQFPSYREATEFFIGTQFAFKNYLLEFSKLRRDYPDLQRYIEHPESLKYLAENKLRKPDAFQKAESYILDYCGYCLPGASGNIPSRIEIGPTGIKYKEDELLKFAKDEELKKKRGEEMLDAARRTFRELQIFSPEKVSEIYYPHDETTSQLLLKLSGYSFSDWENK